MDAPKSPKWRVLASDGVSEWAQEVHATSARVAIGKALTGWNAVVNQAARSDAGLTVKCWAIK